MKERGILFTAPMVRALIAGTKMQTRRVVKPQPGNDPTKHHPIAPYHNGRGGWNWVLAETGHGTGDPFACPYGEPADNLRVRETHFAFGRWETRFSAAKERDEWHFVDMTAETGHSYLHEAPAGWRRPKRSGATPEWWRRPAIFMPRAASRITLEITEVRVQRLQDISRSDCFAEGCSGGHGSIPDYHYNATPFEHYRHVWEDINGAGSWALNPWVWAISFRRLHG